MEQATVSWVQIKLVERRCYQLDGGIRNQLVSNPKSALSDHFVRVQ